MTILKIISEWKHYRSSTGQRPRPGYRRVMASVQDGHGVETRHIDIPKEKK